MAPRHTLHVGLIGFGTVGRAFAKALCTNAARLRTRLATDVHLTRIAVRRPDRVRPLAPAAIVGDDPVALADDRAIDIVVEASGDIAAQQWLTAALARGAAVISANKLALASSHSLLDAIATRHPLLHCEGAVAAAVPVIRALRDSLDGEEVREIRGILNATSTFVLCAIERGSSLDDALANAIALGYAERAARGAADLDGRDAAAKLAILATLAWRAPIHIDQVQRRGIDATVEAQARDAVARGQRLRLVAQACRGPADRLVVEPRLLDASDPLASVEGITNAVELRADLAGQLRWFGPGAGGDHTASALLGDLIAAAQAMRGGTHRRVAA